MVSGLCPFYRRRLLLCFGGGPFWLRLRAVCGFCGLFFGFLGFFSGGGGTTITGEPVTKTLCNIKIIMSPMQGKAKSAISAVG